MRGTYSSIIGNIDKFLDIHTKIGAKLQGGVGGAPPESKIGTAGAEKQNYGKFRRFRPKSNNSTPGVPLSSPTRVLIRRNAA